MPVYLIPLSSSSLRKLRERARDWHAHLQAALNRFEVKLARWIRDAEIREHRERLGIPWWADQARWLKNDELNRAHYLAEKRGRALRTASYEEKARLVEQMSHDDDWDDYADAPTEELEHLPGSPETWLDLPDWLEQPC